MLCQVHRLGLVPYKEAWQLQDRLAQEIAIGERPPSLLLLEHPHTFTFGRRGRAENLLWNEQELSNKGIEVHWVDRGGDVTYHGPGQLVGYPLIPLGLPIQTDDPETNQKSMPPADYIGYLRNLEKVLIKSLAHFGLVSGQIEGLTGVWIQANVLSRCKHCPPELHKAPAKIASIGVKVDSKGITRHGFALNIGTDMQYWDGILACGLENQNKVKLEYLLDPLPSIDQITDIISDNFGIVFGYQMVNHVDPPQP